MTAGTPRKGPTFSSLLSTGLFLLSTFVRPAAANCECGYSAFIEGNAHLFTDLIESDFAHLASIETNTDWERQAFNVTSVENRGSYGEMFDIDGLQTLPSPNSKVEDGNAQDGQPAGLRLTVRSNLVGGMIPVSEIDTSRDDVFYGTYRAGIRLTNVPGTCSAFFWVRTRKMDTLRLARRHVSDSAIRIANGSYEQYYNDTQEIDMEFLSKDYNSTNSSYPVNLVLQSREAAEHGYDAQKTPNYKKVYLPFDPTADFHEYRIDFLPGTVVFYADNQPLARMDGDAVPTHAGHLVLQQWSNGNPLWSGGPPTEDAVTTVAYVKAYFNSSTDTRQRDWALRCHDTTAPNAVCAIPEVTATNTTPTDWFFTGQTNMSNNQTVSGQDNLGTKTEFGLWLPFAVVLAVVGWEGGFW